MPLRAAPGLRVAALEERLKAETVDVTLPVRPAAAGTIHPVSQVREEVVQIFADSASGWPRGRTSSRTGTTSAP